MPAQIFLTKAQVKALGELDEDVVVTEGPGAMSAEALDIWIMDEETLGSDTHRSVVIDPQGNTIGDERMED